MTEYTEPPVPETDGYRSRPGYVKGQPGNNEHYVEQFADDPWYPAIKRCHEELKSLVLGYNIVQIKAKFGNLRYYISQGDCPNWNWELSHEDALSAIARAETSIRHFEKTGRWDDDSLRG